MHCLKSVRIRSYSVPTDLRNSESLSIFKCNIKKLRDINCQCKICKTYICKNYRYILYIYIIYIIYTYIYTHTYTYSSLVDLN